MAFPNSVANNNNITPGLYNFVGTPQGWYNCYFADGTSDRYAALCTPSFGTNAFTIGMWKSTNTGTTWAEIDGANRITLQGTNTPDYAYHGNNSVIDTAGRLIHVIYWNTSSHMASRPFDIAAGTWGAAINSTLSDPSAAINTAIPTKPKSYQFICAYRPNDKAVWAAFKTDGDYHNHYDPSYGTGNTSFGDTEKILGAKVLTTGAWDATLTTLAGTATDGYHFTPEGMVTDTAGNINVFYTHVQAGVQAYGHYVVSTQVDFGTATNVYVDGFVIDSGGQGYGPSPPNLKYVIPHSEFSDPGPFLSTNGIIITVTGESVTGLSATNTHILLGSDSAVGTNTHWYMVGGTATQTLFNKQISTLDALSSEQVIVKSTFGPGVLSRPICSTANIISFTYSPFNVGTFTAAELHSIRGTAGVSPTWEDLNIASIDTDMGTQGFISNVDTMNISGTDYALYGFYSGTSPQICQYLYSTSGGIGTGWTSGTLIGTIIQSSTFSFPDTFCLFNPQGKIGFGMGYGNNFGMGYWELSPAPPGAVQIFFMPQYIKRHNAPGN